MIVSQRGLPDPAGRLLPPRQRRKAAPTGSGGRAAPIWWNATPLCGQHRAVRTPGSAAALVQRARSAGAAHLLAAAGAGLQSGASVVELRAGRGALFVGNLLHSPMQIPHPDHGCCFDFDAARSRASRDGSLHWQPTKDCCCQASFLATTPRGCGLQPRRAGLRLRIEPSCLLANRGRWHRESAVRAEATPIQVALPASLFSLCCAPAIQPVRDVPGNFHRRFQRQQVSDGRKLVYLWVRQERHEPFSQNRWWVHAIAFSGQ